MILPTIRLKTGAVEMIDQTLLPGEYKIIRLVTVDAVCEAIKMLRVRGAPALGVAGAYGLLIALEERWGPKDGYFFDDGVDDGGPGARLDSFPDVSTTDVCACLGEAGARLGATRPTAVNLVWALKRMEKCYSRDWGTTGELLEALLAEAVTIYREDIDMCRALGRHGAELIADGDAVLTHCNTGGLATSGYGTALGVVFSAVESGKSVHVYADETRPLLQGARLTAWECTNRNIPVTVLVDGAAASLLSRGGVACAIVGADRIAANGDTANKIGTLSVALIANRFNVPFYVAAPSSTIDTSLSEGSQIPIEERMEIEVKSVGGVAIAPDKAAAFNPAFDVTPSSLIAGIITENGVYRPPYSFGDNAP